MGKKGASNSDRSLSYWPGKRLLSMGSDGLAMLVLANAFVAATLGLSLLWQLHRVHRIARNAPIAAAGPGWRLVFGVCLGTQTMPPDFALRLERARSLPQIAPILILGGHTGRGALSEAMAGRDWLVRHGVSPVMVLTEDGSRNTLENLRAARHRLDKAGAPPVLITNRYHLARTSALATGLGLRHELCAAEDRLSYRPRQLMKMLTEAYLLNWYDVGRTWATLTGHRGMMGRIT